MVVGQFSRAFDDFRKENVYWKRNAVNVVKLDEISHSSVVS
jgi:hypothetical protein